MCAVAGGGPVGAGSYVGAARSTSRYSVPIAAHQGHWSGIALRRREYPCECTHFLYMLWPYAMIHGSLIGDTLAAFHIEIPNLSCAAHHFETHVLAYFSRRAAGRLRSSTSSRACARKSHVCYVVPRMCAQTCLSARMSRSSISWKSAA